MSWIFLFFWVLVGAFCIYMFIDITRTKTNAEKISRIKEEMEQVDKIHELNTKMAKTRQQNTQEWTEFYEYSIQVYEDVKQYLVQTTRTIIQFAVDIIRRRVYALIG